MPTSTNRGRQLIAAVCALLGLLALHGTSDDQELPTRLRSLSAVDKDSYRRLSPGTIGNPHQASTLQVGDANKCVIEYSKDGEPQIARYHTSNPSFYELCVRADSGPGPVTPYGMCMALESSENHVAGKLPPFSGNATLTLKHVWKHENWDYSKERSCEDLWVDSVACQWIIQGSLGKNQVKKTFSPIPSSFFDTFDSVFFVGDSTVRMFYDAFRGRCLHSLDKDVAPGESPFELSAKLRVDTSTMCGNLLITYIVNMGDPSTRLGNLPVRAKSLIVFNLAHTYVWYDKTDMLPVLVNIEQTMKAKQFPNLVFLHAPAMNTKKWKNADTGPFQGYNSRCTHNNVMVKHRHQEALDHFKKTGTSVPVVDVFYESLASIPECSMDGVHYCNYVYNLMVDQLLEVDHTLQGNTAGQLVSLE